MSLLDGLAFDPVAQLAKGRDIHLVALREEFLGEHVEGDRGVALGALRQRALNGIPPTSTPRSVLISNRRAQVFDSTLRN